MSKTSPILSILSIDLNLVIDIKNFIQSLNVWQEWRNSHEIKDEIEDKAQSSSSNNMHSYYFKKYFRAIKPVIYNFSLIQKLDPKKYVFFTSDLQAKQVQQLKQIFEPLRQFQIVDKNSSKFEQIKSNSSQESVKSMLFQVISDIFKTPQNPIYKMDLISPPENNEVKFWKNTVPMPKVIISGLVIKGKGVAAKDLGMPTVNIQLSQNSFKKLINYPNAIYATIVKLLSGQFYLGAAGFGTNPHYQNAKSQRFLQIYILHDFKEVQLYGQAIEVTFLDLIRLQVKFPSFDAFLNGMRNDIEITKSFQKQLILIQQPTKYSQQK